MRRSAALEVDGQSGAHSVDVEVGGVADTAYLPSEPVSLNTANASLIRDGESGPSSTPETIRIDPSGFEGLREGEP